MVGELTADMGGQAADGVPRQEAQASGVPAASSSENERGDAEDQEPRGTSVSAGCSGASNQTPSSVLRAVVPPASTASCTFGWTPSATLSRKGRASTMRWLSVAPMFFPPFREGTRKPIPEEGLCHSARGRQGRHYPRSGPPVSRAG